MDKILRIEDDARERAISEFLKERGYEVLVADGKSASQLVGQTPDIIVTVLNLAGSGGLEVLRHAHQVLPETPVVIITGHGTVFIASVVEAMRRGGFDCLTEPMEPEELLPVIRRATERSVLQRELRRVRQQVNERGGFQEMVGQSEPSGPGPGAQVRSDIGLLLAEEPAPPSQGASGIRFAKSPMVDRRSWRQAAPCWKETTTTGATRHELDEHGHHHGR